MKQLTATSYALLGLLASRSWTAYELTKQMERTIGEIWPRTQSKLFEEPQNLVAHGLAEVHNEHTGKRPRAVYSITLQGREALRAWLATPGMGPVIEFEALLKVFFADQGSKESLLLQIKAMSDWATMTKERGREFLEAYVSAEGTAAQQLHMMGLMSAFLLQYAEVVSQWAGWATEMVTNWPGVGVGAPNKRIFLELLERAAGDAPRGTPEVHRTGRSVDRRT